MLAKLGVAVSGLLETFVLFVIKVEPGIDVTFTLDFGLVILLRNDERRSCYSFKLRSSSLLFELPFLFDWQVPLSLSE